MALFPMENLLAIMAKVEALEIVARVVRVRVFMENSIRLKDSEG